MTDAAQHSFENNHKDLSYDVPAVLKPRGLYAIELKQAEMYELGVFGDISHFIIYDRGNKIAVDVTAEVRSAPMLSKTPPADVLSMRVVESIEKLLTGEDTPQPRNNSVLLGVGFFKAVELDATVAGSLRASLETLAEAKIQHEEAIRSFENASRGIFGAFAQV